MFLQAQGQRDVVKVVICIDGSAQCLVKREGGGGDYKIQLKMQLCKNISLAGEKLEN